MLQLQWPTQNDRDAAEHILERHAWSFSTDFLIAQSADGPWRKAAFDLGDVEYDDSLFCGSAAARRFAMRESHGGADCLRV